MRDQNLGQGQLFGFSSRISQTSGPNEQVEKKFQRCDERALFCALGLLQRGSWNHPRPRRFLIIDLQCSTKATKRLESRGAVQQDSMPWLRHALQTRIKQSVHQRYLNNSGIATIANTKKTLDSGIQTAVGPRTSRHCQERRFWRSVASHACSAGKPTECPL